ncbi:uncharacterized protein GIQ15_00965 [Arthroderma uncinatum]|uniref:uncharacterized protein n=1 Tax=Arthroderma uncinatum TaxID=74035 RepID=UPI00144AC4E0|nr:uncharacterized protein GIQ15_00965 [Arthroderma uncinatum]KAF3491448.1 hypothetical protein GIQ15_00965 [Arthroderma uncinatum]
MASRSSTSSPDPLGYPGDPDYLLSSARKPFPQRSMSPQKAGTPRRGRPPLHQKNYQSPRKTDKKTAQTIRLEDILLPSTPSGNSKATRFDRRSLSPTKAVLQSDGNISPWRIRVTVEAEQEEDEDGNQANTQTRLGPWIDGKTVKVPLKGTSSTEPTPKRRRRRKSKSDIAERPPTPRHKKGSTPTKKVPESTEKRTKTGTHKSTPVEDIVAPTVEDNISPQDFEEPTQDFGDVFLDIAADGDMNDDDDDGDLMDQNVELTDPAMEAPPVNADSNPSLSTNAVGVAPLDRRKPPASQENLATSSIPSGLSPINVVNAGRTPRPKRAYPTPTSSSLVGDETLEKSTHRVAGLESTASKTKDPTDEHREFDSIMESEGFSMVSLNTLPSARQRLRQLFENQASRTKSPKSNGTPAAPQHISPKPASIAALSPNISTTQSSSKRPHSQLYEAISSLQQSSPRDMTSRPQRTPRLNTISSARPPPAPATPATTIPAKRRPLARLCRVIRAGIALHGLMDRRRQSGNLQTPFSSPNTDHTDDIEATKQRLDHLFQDFNMETRRELRAGVRFGEELAKRLRQPSGKRRELPVARESTRLQEVTSMRPSKSVVYPDLGVISEGLEPSPAPKRPDEQITRSPRQEPSPVEDNTGDTSIDSLMARREAEWRREREAISRQIELANDSQVIVINSDDGVSQPAIDPGTGDPTDAGYEERAEDVMIDEQEELEEQEEADYGEETDIWQQAAREPEAKAHSPSLSHIAHDERPNRRTLGFPSPRAGSEEEAYSANDGDEMVPLPDLSSRRHAFPELTVGKSKMAQYRDTEASLSPLLGTPESATRRFYEGDFSRSNVETARHHPSRGTLESLPRRDSRPISPELNEPPIPHNGSSKRHQQLEGDFELEQTDEGRVQHSYTQPRRLANPTSATPEEEAQLQRAGPSLSKRVALKEPPGENDVDGEMEEASEDDIAESDISGPSVPEPPEQTSTVTWFNKLTSNLAPAWLTSTPAPVNASKRRSTTKYPDPTATPVAAPAAQPPTRKQSNDKGKAPARHRFVQPLAISGYFTDDHYVELREIYRQAKVRPENFKYYPTEERDEMIGQWMWSADGQHRRQVTEIQLVIVERFRQKLIQDNIRHGGDGAMEWSEEDILWRLFSIIVGEQIRRQRKEQQQRQQLQH